MNYIENKKKGAFKKKAESKLYCFDLYPDLDNANVGKMKVTTHV